MSDNEAFAQFTKLRFASTDGQPVCPRCGCDAVYRYRCRRAFKCKRCSRQFSATSGTVLAYRKLSFRSILLGVADFIRPAKGRSSIELSHLLGVQQKTAFVLGHKLRDLLLWSLAELVVSGDVEVDGAEFGGHLRPKNVRKKSTDHRKFPHRHSRKKRHLVVARERGGHAITTVVETEGASLPFLHDKIATGSVVYADLAACWNILEATYETHRINHKQAYYTTEASTNWAESFFSVVRRSVFGIYHRPSMKYLTRYGAEIAWRQNKRNTGAHHRYEEVIEMIGRFGRSSFSGYWQRYQQKKEPT